MATTVENSVCWSSSLDDIGFGAMVWYDSYFRLVSHSNPFVGCFHQVCEKKADDPDTDPCFLYLRIIPSCIFALMTTSFTVTTLVMTALIILSLTRSFQCMDDSTRVSVECRLCGTFRMEGGGNYDCNGGQQAFAHSLEGFSSTVVWLVFASFHLGKAMEITGLGKRLSLWMVRIFGKHILGLAYSIVFSGTVQIRKKK
jgi:DASS family divalent anion:Na+ symporter